MSSAIKPTIGRRVWYYRHPGEDAVQYDIYQPFDAAVIFVHNDNLVNLLITDHAGNVFPKHNVELVQPDDQQPRLGGYCTWMPYQIKQASVSQEPPAA